MNLVTILSVILFTLGLFTNFNVEVDGDVLWTPLRSRPMQHDAWIRSPASGYPTEPRILILFFHRNGDTILTRASVDRAFLALDTVRSVTGYDNACDNTCGIQGVVRFWDFDAQQFRSQIATDRQAIEALSATAFPDGTLISEHDIFGLPTRDPASGLLTHASSLSVFIEFPKTDDAKMLESRVLGALLNLRKAWAAETDNDIVLQFLAERSFDDEFERAILSDVPLVPIVFTTMGTFTAVVFARRDMVKSRVLLGTAAVISVFLSLASGYGLLFIANVPFTNMTQLLPFVIVGVGLDDIFVIMGAYLRASANHDTLKRIQVAINEVGSSVTLTTSTSVLAFGLGALSSIPAVRWVCLYAFPTIAFVYLYQLTFFIAAIVLDEERIQNNRYDVFPCLKIHDAERMDEGVSAGFDGKHQLEKGHFGNELTPTFRTQAGLFDRLMEWYIKHLFRPRVKLMVFGAFGAFLGLCTWSAFQLTQDFDFTDVMPKDSYATHFFEARKAYTTRNSAAPYAYFREVDQSVPQVQEQMRVYVQQLVDLKSIPEPPPFFWLTSLVEFVEENPWLADSDFASQLDAFLAVPEYQDLYSQHIVLDPATGEIVTSRVRLFMDAVDPEIISQQIDALKDQRGVSERQLINAGQKDLRFFTFDNLYLIWEFYAASVEELIFSTIVGVVSVTTVALFFVPHWTAALFTLPMICVLYVDLLGFMQWGGVHINAVSYVTLVMSIGLLVDFVLHVLLRYYECPGNRREKTTAMLKSMGVSILTGGFSTFLGALPLAFSTSEIFRTIFIGFLGLSTLGMAHSLILLPVVLSTIGPQDEEEQEKQQEQRKDMDPSGDEDDEENDVKAVIQPSPDKNNNQLLTIMDTPLIMTSTRAEILKAKDGKNSTCNDPEFISSFT